MGTHHMGNTAAGAAVPLLSALLLAAFAMFPVSVSAQTPDAAAKSEKPGRTVTSEELEKAYLQLPETKLPTPRTADGHPDLSGFYYNPLDITVKRAADGNIYYSFGETRTDAPPPRYPEPAEPSYKPEYEAKVKGILERQYGTTPQDDRTF